MASGFLRQIKAQTRGLLRRQRDALFPSRATVAYRSWMSAHTAARSQRYSNTLEPGLLSVITAVWDGSPVPYLDELARSIAHQITASEAQWFIIANGCSRPDLVACLHRLASLPFVSVRWLSRNAGIVAGLQQCLQRASGRYVLPVDADDLLYPDALRIVTSHIRENAYPALLYTDEDKLSNGGPDQPYFKPDWDPVLLSNSAYIAHLGVVHRESALEYGAYSDANAEGSADWDLFTRFANAGQAGIHIPEVVYSWRIHAQSTSDDIAAKPYIRSSQEAVLRRFLASHHAGSSFSVQANPLFGSGAAHLHLARNAAPSLPLQILEGVLSLAELVAPAQALAQQGGYLGLVASDVEVDPKFPNWRWEALGLFELFPDATMVGGRVTCASGQLVDGPRYLGFGKLCDPPDIGRQLSDPGYFGQLWKQRSVGSVGARHCLFRAAGLARVLATIPAEATLEHLGVWVAADALRTGRRILYSPFLHAIAKGPVTTHMALAEESAFRKLHADLIPDRRFYPAPFSLKHGYRIEESS